MACVGGGEDGSPHPRGQGKGGGKATRFFTPLRYVQNDMWGSGLWTEWHVGEEGRRWVPASARTREGGREGNEILHSASLRSEWHVWEGEKMGPRIREDTEGRAPPFLRRAEGRLNLAASVGERDWGDAGGRVGRGWERDSSSRGLLRMTCG